MSAHRSPARARNDLVDRIVRALDGFMSRRLGIWEIASDPDCMFRIACGRAPEEMEFPDGVRLPKGAPVAILHFWGDHVPVLPPEGADLAWARRTLELAERSLRSVAREMQTDPRLQGAQALGNTVSLPYGAGTLRVLERLGFTVFPEPRRGAWAALTARGSQLWTRLLRRAYNPASNRAGQGRAYSTRPLWMLRSTLLSRYGSSDDPRDDQGSTDNA